jgi:hypothetical protein
MSKSMNKLIYSSQSKQSLIHYYEELRSLVLDKSKIINGNLGHSIVLFRGMPAWIKTCLSSELIYRSQPSLSHFEKIASAIEKQPIVLPREIQEEATMILTNIILSHQLLQEPGNCYA